MNRRSVHSLLSSQLRQHPSLECRDASPGPPHQKVHPHITRPLFTSAIIKSHLPANPIQHPVSPPEPTLAPISDESHANDFTLTSTPSGHPLPHIASRQLRHIYGARTRA